MVASSGTFHRGRVFAAARGSVATGSMIEGLLCRRNVGVLARQMSSAGCWMARENENVTAHGNRDLKRTFMAFKRAEASSLGLAARQECNARNRSGHGTQENCHRRIGHFIDSFPAWGRSSPAAPCSASESFLPASPVAGKAR